MVQTAFKFEAEVQENGKVELNVPLSPGARVTVFVVEEQGEFRELLLAAESSLDFWDNPWDDEDWSDG